MNVPNFRHITATTTIRIPNLKFINDDFSMYHLTVDEFEFKIERSYRQYFLYEHILSVNSQHYWFVLQQISNRNRNNT